MKISRNSFIVKTFALRCYAPNCWKFCPNVVKSQLAFL